MIKIYLTRKDDNIKSVIIKGHAMYDDFGKDIVCSAVSSSVITSVNACLSIDEESISYKELDGLEITVNKSDYVTTKIIDNMIYSLKKLEEAYPKNIQIKEENNG